MGGGVIILRLIKRFDFWLVLIAGLFLVAAVVLGAGMGSGSGSGAAADPAGVEYSTYNPGPDGLKGIYTFLEARQVPVQRWRQPLTRLPDSVDTLVIWQPEVLEMDEWSALRRWVEQGGVLLFSPRDSSGNLTPNPVLALRPLPITGGPVRPTTINPVMLGVQSLEAGSAYLIGASVHSAVETVAMTSSGHPAMAGWELGEGRVYLVADPGLMANATLPSRDNLTFAVNLLGDPARTVYFDEYHHGALLAQDWWQTLRPQLRWTMLQAVLATLILLILAGARFGREVAVPEGISRQASEFALGLAHLLRESRANRWVLDRLHRRFRADLARYLGAAPTASHDELGRLWSLHTGEPAEPLMELLRASSPEWTPKPADRDVANLVRRMAEYRRRLTGSGSIDAQTEEEGQP